MGLSVKVATLTWNEADGAGTTYDVTLGFTPVMLGAFALGNPSATDAVGRDTTIATIGLGTGSADRRVCSFTSLDGQGTAAITVRHTAAAIAAFDAGAGAFVGALDVDAEANWPANGVRFIVDTQITTGVGNIRVSLLALGGTDITDAATLQFQEPGATGSQTIAHGLSGTPTGVLFVSSGLATAPDAQSNTQGMLMIGASDGTNNWVSMLGGDDGNTTMDTASYAKSGECIALAPEPAVTLNGRAAVTGFDATNITLNWSERAATRYIFALAWVGGSFHVDTVLTATDTNSFSETGYGFQPTAALFASACRAESTADTPTADGRLSIGVATGASERVCQAMLDEDGVGTSEVTTAIEHDEVYAHISTASAIEALMDLVSFDSDGLTLVMDDAEASVQSFVGVAAWGATPPAAGTAVPVFVHHYRQQGIM